MMKRILLAGFAAIVMFATTGCGNKNARENTVEDSTKVEVADTALYGIVGEGTSMHSLEVTDGNGKSTTYVMDAEGDADIQGGIFAGDNITFSAWKNADGEMQVTKLVNVTTLCGKWTSLDRNFEIKEDGTVESHQAGETKPYTQWSMVNCNIVLNIDTFAINYLGPDSLTLENQKGIYVYKRVK